MNALVKSLTLADLIARGAPQVFTATSKLWKQVLVTWFETNPDGPKRKLYPAQMEMVFIDMLSYALALLGREAQIAVEQRWLAFAEGHHLDLMAANNSTFRLLAAPAVCTLQFTLDEAQPFDTIIPSGTRVEANGDVIFAIGEELIIAAGQTIATITGTAIEPGNSGNGFAAGQVSSLLDGPDVELAVTNLDESTGGADQENDDALRYRAANAHDRISKAGPRESYRQQTLAFSSAIIAVAVTRPEPGDMNVYPLLVEGAPDAAFLSAVGNWLDYETKRPQGDDVFVLAPEAVTFTITGTGRANGDLIAMKAAIETALAAAALIWSRQLGSYLALSVLTCAARQLEGLVDIDIAVDGIVDRQLEEHQFAVLTDVTITMEAA